MESRIVLGLPIVGLEPKTVLWCPLNRQDEFQEWRSELLASDTYIDDWKNEYLSVARALREMGVDFSVVNQQTIRLAPYAHRIYDRWLDGVNRAEIVSATTKDVSSLRFPRDLATKLPNGGWLADIALNQWEPPNGSSIFKSAFGQGGRAHCRKGTMLVVNNLVTTQNLSEDEYVAHRRLGLRIGQLPHGICYLCERIGKDWNEYTMAYNSVEEHVDRMCGLLEDSDGKLHLIVDPLLQSGWSGLTGKPKLTIAKTLKRYRQVCREMDIEMHVPLKIEIPYSFGFIQFEDGRVLMTSGDSYMTKLVTDIVGRDNVFQTDVPIIRAPVLSGAGIRCLIGEIPVAMIQK